MKHTVTVIESIEQIRRPTVPDSDLTPGQRLARMQRQYQTASGQETSAMSRLFAHIIEMENRIAVLEQLVIDRGA